MATNNMMNNTYYGPYFWAYIIIHDTGAVTGDGTRITVPYDTTLYNVGSGYNTTTYTFTAPADGLYELGTSVGLEGLNTSAATGILLRLITSVTDPIIFGSDNMLYATSVYNVVSAKGQTILYMQAGDTAYIDLLVAGSSKNTDIAGSVNSVWNTYFYGLYLRE
jgi:hypothetical protein